MYDHVLLCFRFLHNSDAMAVEKLAEGIRKFAADQVFRLFFRTCSDVLYLALDMISNCT